MSKYNILFITATLNVGGLETYLVNVIKTLSADVFHSTVVYNSTGDPDFLAVLEKHGAEILRIPNFYLQVDFIVRLIRIIRDRKIDIVCDFRDDFSAPSMLAAKIAGVRSRVAMYRSSRPCFMPTFAKNLYAAGMHKIVKSTATRIIGNSTKVLDNYYPNWKRMTQCAVVPNGIPLAIFTCKHDKLAIRRELGIPVDAFVIGHVGRLHESKNHTVILETFIRVKQSCPQAYLLLVGDGPLRGQIVSKLAQKGISGSTFMVGQRKDVARMLSSMDLFLYPSIYEGMPTAFVEAMATGLPFVASTIEEIMGIVPDNLKGQLFNPTNAVEMAASILRMIENPVRMQELSQIARDWAIKNFSIETSVANLTRYFLELLQK